MNRDGSLADKEAAVDGMALVRSQLKVPEQKVRDICSVIGVRTVAFDIYIYSLEASAGADLETALRQRISLPFAKSVMRV